MRITAIRCRIYRISQKKKQGGCDLKVFNSWFSETVSRYNLMKNSNSASLWRLFGTGMTIPMMNIMKKW